MKNRTLKKRGNILKTKIILEAGCNHNGEIGIATDMICEASRLGVWGIKFQKRDCNLIPDDVKKKTRDLSNSFGKTYYEHRLALEFDAEEMNTIKTVAEKMGLKFLCSAFDINSLKTLVDIGCEYIKLPSQLYTDKKLQTELIDAKSFSGIKALVSTGMHSAEEILNNLWLDYADIIFHCISVYPCNISDMNIVFIQALKEIVSHHENDCAIGYSSHDFEGRGIPYAIAAGAEYIERHYTLDKKMKGSDHSTVSSDLKEIKNIIQEINLIEEILGDSKRECSEKELQVRKIYRGF